ncbi:hypothetical protein ABPG77_008708 [Micractinium sp. CCAP 211/92]
MSALERTASNVQGTLFQAARGPLRGCAVQPPSGHVEAVRASMRCSARRSGCGRRCFAQVYAELLQKDNSDLSFNAEGQP